MEARLYSFLRLQAGTRLVSIPLAQPAPLTEVLSLIVQRHPKLAGSILTADGQLAAHMVVTINGNPWRREDISQPLIRDEDTLDLFLAIGGGVAPPLEITSKTISPSGRAEE